MYHFALGLTRSNVAQRLTSSVSWISCVDADGDTLYDTVVLITSELESSIGLVGTCGAAKNTLSVK